MHTQRLLPLAAALAAAALLAGGCGGAGSSGSADDPADPATATSPTSPTTSSSPEPKDQPSRPPGSEKPVRSIVSAGGAARGTLETKATPLPDKAAIEAYAAALGTSLRTPFVTEATSLLEQVPPGETLFAQSVYDGCAKPDPATIAATESGGEVVLSVKPPKSTKVQCLVAERSVALLSR